MKRLLLLLLLIPGFAFAQDIPKFTNTIFVKGVSFKKAKATLLDSAYFIDQQNEEDGTIVTKPKGVCDCHNKDFNQLIISIRVKDSTARISGTFNINYNSNAQKGGLFSNDRTEFHQLEYWKSGISSYHKIFLIMDSIARAMGRDVTYAKQ